MFLKARKIKTVLSVGCSFGFKCSAALLLQKSNKQLFAAEKLLNRFKNIFRKPLQKFQNNDFELDEITYESRFTLKTF